MNDKLEFQLNQATEEEIAEHLSRCDDDFIPRLSSRVELSSYARKIANKAMRFEAWEDSLLTGLVAVYSNDKERSFAYITSVSVLNQYQGKGVASFLIEQCIRYSIEKGIERIELEVDSKNAGAIKLYEKMGFVIIGAKGGSTIMFLRVEEER